MKILKKFFISVLVFILVLFQNKSSFAMSDFDLKFQEAQDDLKSGAQYILVTKIKNEPMHCFELFRYTALDDIISSLKFEKDPWEFIENKYGKKVKILRNYSTVAATFVGAGLGILFWKWITGNSDKEKKFDLKVSQEKFEQKILNGNNKKSSFLDKLKKRLLPTFVVLAGMLTTSMLISLITKIYSNNFMEEECKKLYVEKENALSAMKDLITHIERKNWEQGDSILIQINSNPNYPTAVPTIINSGINYSNEEIKKFPESFETLRQNLEKILKENNYEK